MNEMDHLRIENQRLRDVIHGQNDVIDQQTSTILHQSEVIRIYEREREYARLQRKVEKH